MKTPTKCDYCNNTWQKKDFGERICTCKKHSPFTGSTEPQEGQTNTLGDKIYRDGRWEKVEGATYDYS